MKTFSALANSTGYREWTYRVQEAVFEGLPNQEAKDWHVQFSKKMETVKNFNAFYHSFMIGVLEVALPHDKHGVVQPVIDLHKNYKNATEEDWIKASDAAADAARAGAWAAAAVWDTAAARAGAWDAAAKAAAAALAAARAGARAGARAAKAADAKATAWALWGAARTARAAARTAKDVAWALAWAADADADWAWAWAADADAARAAARTLAWQKIKDVFLNADGGE